MKIKEILKKSIFPLIMCIFSLLIGLIFIYLSKGDPWKIRFFILLMAFIPFIIFLIITILTNILYNKKNFRTISIVITGILTSVVLIYYCFAIFMCAIIEAENPITDIKYYKGKVHDKRLLKVFPKEIPNNVKDIDFIYSPRFLQGRTIISLYYIDKKIDLKKFDTKYKKIAIWIGYKEEYTKNEGLLTGAFLNTPVEKNNNNFKIYLVEGKCDKSGYCNHGNYLFAAINGKTNEVIYQSNEW